MKKKIIGFIVILTIAAISALNINFSSQNEGLSIIILSNIEALAQSETAPPVIIPCCPDTGKSCTVSVIDGLGNKGTLTVKDARYCGI